MTTLYVINSIGKKEPFSLKKVYRSCRRVGASKDLARKVSKEIEKNVYSGIKTSEIFKWVSQLLSKEAPRSLIRFSLKEAMRRLGPSGFDFEKYIAEIFSKEGFEVKINQQIPGYCISSYEIDFLAKKKDLTYIGECKYHYLPGKRVDLKIALSNHARSLDISKNHSFKGELRNIMVTNTKFTSEVIKYAKCVGIELLGWNYPSRKGLESIIEKLKLYPITILPSFKRYFKKIFAQERMMLALDLLSDSPQNLVKKLGLPQEEIESLIEEAKVLLE